MVDLGRLRSDDLKGQSVWQLIGETVAHNVDRAIDRVALTPGHGWCIGPNRAFPALVYHLHPRVCVYLLSLSAYVHPDACRATGVTAPECFVVTRSHRSGKVVKIFKIKLSFELYLFSTKKYIFGRLKIIVLFYFYAFKTLSNVMYLKL